MSDNTYWVVIWAMVISALVALVTVGVVTSVRHDEKMAALGYQETLVPGSCSPIWQKVPQPGATSTVGGGVE